MSPLATDPDLIRIGNCSGFYGDRISALNETPGGVEVTFRSGAVRTYDLVVGADGIYSGVRALAWTTTPWTLPTNLALAVGPDIEYVVVPGGPLGASDVHESAAEGEAHALGDRDAGLLLGLVGRGAEVRRDDDVVELEQRAVRRHRFDGEHIEARRREATGTERVDEGVLVDDGPAGRVDEHGTRLHRCQGVAAEQSGGV